MDKPFNVLINVLPLFDNNIQRLKHSMDYKTCTIIQKDFSFHDQNPIGIPKELIEKSGPIYQTHSIFRQNQFSSESDPTCHGYIFIRCD